VIHEDQKVVKAGKDLADADKAVIMVHGRGATAESVIRLSEKLPEASYLAPQAENRTWYPKSFLRPREENQPHLDSALEKLDKLIQKCSEELGKENVFLLGFSQGGCLVSEYTASNPARYGGLIILSGGLIGEEVKGFSGDMESTEVFIGCAENDPHIPRERVDETEDVFESLNAEVEKYIFEGSHHGIVEYEIERASEIIGRDAT
jgi:phospholipase/carboxylesterase